MRELVGAAVRGFSAPSEPQSLSREEETLFHVLADRRQMVSLGSITYAFKAMRNAKAGILRHAASQLNIFGMLDLTTPRTVKLLLNDVLNRYRNGGAHEQQVEVPPRRGRIPHRSILYDLGSTGPAGRAGLLGASLEVSSDGGVVRSSEPVRGLRWSDCRGRILIPVQVRPMSELRDVMIKSPWRKM